MNRQSWRWCGAAGASSAAACALLAALSPIAGAATKVADATGVFKVAIMTPLTGGDAEEGTAVRDGASLALAKINASGGIDGEKLALEYLDTKGDPTTAATTAAEIVGQYQSGDVQVAMGPSDSDETLAAVPILQRAGVPDINTTASSPEITQRHFSDFVRLVQSDVSQATQVIDFATFNLHKARLAIVYENNDYGQGVEEYDLKAAKADGAKVVSVQTYTPNQDTDFSTQITAIAKAKPTAVILDTSYNEGGEILRQAHNLGLTNVAWVGVGDNLYHNFITLANGRANGVYILTVFDSFSKAPITTAFVKPFEAKFKSIPAEGAWTAYDGLLMIQKAIKAGGTPKNLIAKLKATPFAGAGGTYAFDANGDVTSKPLFVDTVAGNKFVPTGMVVKLHA